MSMTVRSGRHESPPGLTASSNWSRILKIFSLHVTVKKIDFMWGKYYACFADDL